MPGSLPNGRGPAPLGPLLLALAFLSGCAAGHPGDGASGPLIAWYQDVISPVDGDRCPMAPSCSHYAQEAFRKHGWFWGWIMTSERLMRCGHDEIHLSPPVVAADGIHYADPLSANDFWFSERKAP